MYGQFSIARAITSPRLMPFEQHKLAILEALVVDGGTFDLSDHQLEDLRDLRNRAEGEDRWELEQFAGNGDWYLVDTIARWESDQVATAEYSRIEAEWDAAIMAGARELVRRDLDIAVVATELQRDHFDALRALGSPDGGQPEQVAAYILEAAWDLYLDAHATQSPAIADAWTRLEQIARELGRISRDSITRDSYLAPSAAAWPFHTIERGDARCLRTFAELEQLAATDPEGLKPYQAAALACMRNAAYGTPGRWRAEPTSARAFRVA